MPEIKLVAEVDLASFKKAEKETSDLSDRIADAWSRAWEQVGATATETFLDSFKALDKSAQEALTATKKTASDTLGGAFSEAISGDLQKAGDVLEAFVPNLEKAFAGVGKNLASNLGKELSEGLTKILQDLTIDPLLEAFFSSNKAASSTIAGMTGNSSGGIGSLLSGIGSGNLVTGSLDKIIAATIGTPNAGFGFFEALNSGATFMEAIDVSGVIGQGGMVDSIVSGVSSLFGGGATTATTAASTASTASTGLLSGGSGSLLSVAGPIAATILGVELFAGAMDMEGPITAVMGALQGGGGHTRESALAYITADMEYLAVTTERVQTCLASAVDGVQGFGGSMLMEMAPATREMTILAETAGLSQQQLNAMIDALGPLQGKWIEASEVMATASGAIDRMSDTLSANNEFLVGCSSQADAFALMLTHLASSLELPEAPANALQATIGALVGQWQMGGLSAEDMSFKLKQAFAGALAEAADQADMTTERMRSLEESIRSIPTDWQTYISVVYEEHNKPSTLHSGGRVMHSGGWLANLPRFHSGAQVTNLAQDEVPIIARRGEYVVRAESVTAASLPWLAALNQSGKVPGAAQASPQVNLHLEVHGNILGNESGLEALARTLERKLREIQGGRFGYALG